MFSRRIIELFRGTGNWSEAHAAMGLSVHDGVDTDGRRLRCLSVPRVGGPGSP